MFMVSFFIILFFEIKNIQEKIVKIHKQTLEPKEKNCTIIIITILCVLF